MATDDRRRADKFRSRSRLPRLRHLRRKIEGEGALLNELGPRHQPFVVSRIELLENRTMRFYGRPSQVNMRRFRGMMALVPLVIVDVIEWSFYEPQEQGANYGNGPKGSHGMI